MDVKNIVDRIIAGEDFDEIISGELLQESIVTEPDGSKSVLVSFPNSPHLPFNSHGERCHAKIVKEVPPDGNYRRTAFTAPGYTVYVNMDEVTKDFTFNPYAFIAIKDKRY